MKAKQIALAIGFMASCGLSSIASARTGGVADMGRCADPHMINSPACDDHAQRAGVSQRARTMIANGFTEIDCDHKAEKLGNVEMAGRTVRTGNIEL